MAVDLDMGRGENEGTAPSRQWLTYCAWMPPLAVAPRPRQFWLSISEWTGARMGRGVRGADPCWADEHILDAPHPLV